MSDVGKVVGMMMVRNEFDRYLDQSVPGLLGMCDEVVVLDDGSTDDTVDYLRTTWPQLHVFDAPPEFTSQPDTVFTHEGVTRQVLFSRALELDPDWVVCLDADEVANLRMQAHFRSILDVAQKGMAGALCVRFFDFWNEDHYRDDGLWSIHKRYNPIAMRVALMDSLEFRSRALHSGRFPEQSKFFVGARTDEGVIKHLGWSRAEDRQRKFDQYMKSDPKGEFGSMKQYHSILDEHPPLKPWTDELEAKGHTPGVWPND